MKAHALGLLLLAASMPASAQPRQPDVRDVAPAPVDEAADPLNRFVAATTVEGIVLNLTIDGATIELNSAVPALIRRPRSSREAQAGLADRVTATGFAGGARVSSTTVADPVLNAQDDFTADGTGRGGGLVRITRRQVQIGLATPRRLDFVEISAPSTAATARLDLRPAYERWCALARGQGPLCTGQDTRPQ